MIEYVDIYDKYKKLTGDIRPRKELILNEGEYMLYTLTVLLNYKNEMLITKRSAKKGWAAGFWEIPGGGVRSTEDGLTSAMREVQEETGLSTKLTEYTLIDCYRNTNTQRQENYLVNIYLCKKNYSAKDIKIQKEEVSDFKLLNIDTFKNDFSENNFLHYKRLCNALNLK